MRWRSQIKVVRFKSVVPAHTRNWEFEAKDRDIRKFMM